MKLSRLISLTLTTVGTLAASRELYRRHQWEQQHNRRMVICVDFDDIQAAAIRAGLPLAEMLALLAQNGATHVSLPEMTLNRLLSLGILVPKAPSRPRQTTPKVGHWNYLHGPTTLVSRLAEEMKVRMPYTETAVLPPATLVFAGNLPTIGEIGLGFDTELATQITQAGLGIVPRPVSYAWPEKALLERTLTQARALGRYVAFAGNMVLGHEMHLEETVAALQENGLIFVYFAESRHQKGDWFVAKRLAPHVILGHQFTPDEMIPLDFHAACHNWVHLARERGIRFCYVNFFRVLHATEPLEGITYVHHLKHALEDAGFVVTHDGMPDVPAPQPELSSLSAAGMAVGSMGATAVSSLLNLPEPIAIPLTAVAAAATASLPWLEATLNHQRQHTSHHEHHHHEQHHHHHTHQHHEHHHHHEHSHADLHALYPPSYAPKLLALGAATTAPTVALLSGEKGTADWLAGQLFPVTAAGILAIAMSGPEYQLRIETYRGFNLDWLVPLAVAGKSLPRHWQPAWLGALVAGWWLARRKGMDVLAQVDPGHAEGHTHHISAAMAMLGDVMMAIGPKPARKWAGLGPAMHGVGKGENGRYPLSPALAAIGYELGLVGFRHPERALADTIQLAAPSYTLGLLTGWLARLIT